MKQEAVDGLRAFDLTKTESDCRARIAILKTSYNFANLFETFPNAIKEFEVTAADRQQKLVDFKNSQEGGTL